MYEAFRGVNVSPSITSNPNMVDLELKDLGKFKENPVAFCDKHTFQVKLELGYREIIEGYMSGDLPGNIVKYFDLHNEKTTLVLLATYLDGIEIDSTIEIH